MINIKQISFLTPPDVPIYIFAALSLVGALAFSAVQTLELERERTELDDSPTHAKVQPPLY